MSIATMNPTVNMLQDIAAEWADLFEEKAPLDIRFNVTSNNLLTINGIVLGAVSELDVSNASFDVECFYIPTRNGSYYEIYLHCPHDGRSQIGYIKLISTIYSADCVKPA